MSCTPRIAPGQRAWRLCDITHLYPACYGSPPVGTKVFIRVNQNLDGWQDLPKETSAIVLPAA